MKLFFSVIIVPFLILQNKIELAKMEKLTFQVLSLQTESKTRQTTGNRKFSPQNIINLYTHALKIFCSGNNKKLSTFP